MKSTIDTSLERIAPDELNAADAFDMATLKLHRERYQFAIDHLAPGRILDIACGTGYGSFQMMNAGKLSGSYCTAVDISAHAIEYARSRYAHQAIEYVCEDCMKFTSSVPFNAIVSLETVEHIKYPDLFVKRLYDLLRPGGLLIISAPVTPSTDGNPHHLSDFSTRSFRKLVAKYRFEEINHMTQAQDYSLRMLGSSKNRRLAQSRTGLLKFYLGHPSVFSFRLLSLLKDGFRNKYLTLALRKP
ncbi:MAG TPA: class I SAM-dependent methyltransferase [Puia sp.]|nr:class I SAM-dependent methyltransferase [Puia sp.]